MCGMDYSPLNSLKPLPDPKRCAAAVHDDFGVGHHQCTRKPVDGRRYCRTHDPEAVTARLKAADERYREKLAKEKRRNMAWHGAPFIAALRQIAKGHNDPRALAEETLATNGFPVDV